MKKILFYFAWLFATIAYADGDESVKRCLIHSLDDVVASEGTSEWHRVVMFQHELAQAVRRGELTEQEFQRRYHAVVKEYVLKNNVLITEDYELGIHVVPEKETESKINQVASVLHKKRQGLKIINSPSRRGGSLVFSAFHNLKRNIDMHLGNFILPLKTGREIFHEVWHAKFKENRTFLSSFVFVRSDFKEVDLGLYQSGFSVEEMYLYAVHQTTAMNKIETAIQRGDLVEAKNQLKGIYDDFELLENFNKVLEVNIQDEAPILVLLVKKIIEDGGQYVASVAHQPLSLRSKTITRFLKISKDTDSTHSVFSSHFMIPTTTQVAEHHTFVRGIVALNKLNNIFKKHLPDIIPWLRSSCVNSNSPILLPSEYAAFKIKMRELWKDLFRFKNSDANQVKPISDLTQD